MQLEPTDYEFLRRLVRERAAIVLDLDQNYLIDARLTPLARREGLGSLRELAAILQRNGANGLVDRVVEAMTTNETYFFRDVHPFEALRSHALPDLMQKRAGERCLDLWCGACSSGQEPYSVAMLIREHFPILSTWSVRILASDISGEMLARAKEGKYTQIEVNRGLPANLLVKYFRKQGIGWCIQNELRRAIDFRQINLARSWPAMPQMDVVLLRNVLIYFDVETKKDILARVARLMKPDAFLILGGAETTVNLDSTFEWVRIGQATCYRRRTA